MRYRFRVGFAFALALALVAGCSDENGEGGSGGTAGNGGSAGMPECQRPEDCDDGDECTVDTCIEGVCTHVPAEDGTFCADDSGRCIAGFCWLTSCAGIENGVACFYCGAGTGGGCDYGSCIEGVCELGTTCDVDADCNDENDCTSDSCHSVGICEFAPVRDGTPCAGGSCLGGECAIESSVLPCTEAGIRAAVAQGAGPYTFDCNGPRTVVIEAEIVVARDVTLNGEGNLTVDGNQEHGVFRVPAGVTAEVRGFAVTKGQPGIHNEGVLRLIDSRVSGNHMSGVGGGIFNQGTVALENSLVSDNSNGGIFNVGGTVTVTHSTISANRNSYTSGFVPALAGGIHNGGGTLSVIDSTVSGNDSDGVGGGISNSGGGMVMLINSTVSGNAAGCGGGVFLLDGVVRLTASTVSDNTADEGSGICNGGFYEPGGTVEITNSLLDDECVGDVPLSGGHNVESPGDTCGFDTGKGDLFGVSAEQLNLETLADNGGSIMTHALLTEPTVSVAIDKIQTEDCVDAEGQPLTTDQRGEPRPAGARCDVGAFEVQP